MSIKDGSALRCPALPDIISNLFAYLSNPNADIIPQSLTGATSLKYSGTESPPKTFDLGNGEILCAKATNQF